MNYAFPARGQRETWPYLSLVLWAVLMVWIFGGSLLYLALTPLLEGIDSPLAAYSLEFSSFLPLLLALILGVRWLGRPALTLITADRGLNFRRFFGGAAIWLAMLSVSTGLDFWLNPKDYRFTFEAGGFAVALIVLLLWLPIQTGAEELLFRGLLVQFIAKATARPLVITGVSAMLFALPHLLNPEATGAPLASLIAYGALGWGWTMAAFRIGSLEIAMGAHLANNFFGLLLVGYENSAVPGNAIFTAPAPDMANTAPAAVLTCLVWLGLVRLFQRRLG